MKYDTPRMAAIKSQLITSSEKIKEYKKLLKTEQKNYLKWSKLFNKENCLDF